MRARASPTSLRARPTFPSTSSRARPRRLRAVDVAVNPYETTQLVFVAGSVFALGLTALVLGASGDPSPCAACASTGGEPCAFCSGTGRRESAARATRAERDVDAALGLAPRDPRACVACKGSGLIACRACRGTGYVK